MDFCTAMDNSGFRCSACAKVYKRSEHLQRHYASHRPERPYQCPRCDAAFKRSDVFSRHTKTCCDRPPKARSHAKVACDTCRKSKKACYASAAQPCSNCEQRGVVCAFNAEDKTVSAGDDDTMRFSGNVTHQEESQDAGDFFSYANLLVGSEWIDVSVNDYAEIQDSILPAGTFSQTNALASNTESRKDMLPLGFLENMTRSAGLIPSFDCGTDEQRRLALMTFRSRLPAQPMPNDILLLKSHEIVALIKEVIAAKPRNSPVSLSWSPLLENMCNQFFSPQQVRLKLELYWAIWHPNVNFMHRSTFDPHKAKAVLIAAMCVLGARVSPDEAHRENAKIWLSCVEEMVFQDDDLCDDEKSSALFPSMERIQSLQAAYIVVLFQNWDGNEATKRRIRRFRYSTVVAVSISGPASIDWANDQPKVIRDIGIKHAQHKFYHASPFACFDWNDFAAREQLIRLMLWVFMLDTAFAIFNNMPPRIAIKEMKMHLPFSERCFQAASRELCWQQIAIDGDSNRHLLSSLAERLCRAPLNSMSQAIVADLGPLTLFALAHALHSMIFQAQHTFSYEAQLIPIQSALDNWLSVWQLYCSRYEMHEKHCPLGQVTLTPDNMWMRNGFARYAFDYWLLAKLMVSRISAEVEQRKLEAARSLVDLSSNGDLIDPRPSLFLEEYDETSMQQVNELISDFQKVII